MELKIKITDAVKGILDSYDINDLLLTIPYDYKLNVPALNVYANKIKSTTPIDVTLTEQVYEWLNDIIIKSNTSSVPITLLINYLIEYVADCGKINTKKIKQALDCYGYAVAHDRALFSRILSEYAESSFYNEDTGLSEEDVAYFLAMSSTRTRDIK